MAPGHDHDQLSSMLGLVANGSSVKTGRQREARKNVSRSGVARVEMEVAAATVENDPPGGHERRSEIRKSFDTVLVLADRHLPTDVAGLEIDSDEPTPRRRVTWNAANTEELAVHEEAKARPTSREKPTQSTHATMHHDAIRFGKVRFG